MRQRGAIAASALLFAVVLSSQLTSGIEETAINTIDVEEPLRSALIDGRNRATQLDTAGGRPASLAWGELGMLLQAHNLYEQAVVAYSRAIDHLSDPRWLYLRGVSRGELGQAEEAVIDLRAVTRIESNVAIIWYRLAEALYRAGQLDEALDATNRSLDLDGNLAGAYAIHADVDQALGDLAGAKEALEKAHALAPEAGQIVYRQALVERELGNVKASQRWLSKRRNQFAPAVDDPLLSAVAQYSLNPTFFLSASRRAWERGDAATAISAYRRVLELDPGNQEYHIGYTRLLVAAGQDKEAIGMLDELAAAAPDSAVVWYLRGLVLARQDQLVAAKESIEKSLAIEEAPRAVELNRELEAMLKRESLVD